MKNFSVEKKCTNYRGRLVIKVENSKLVELFVFDDKNNQILKHPVKEDPEIKTIFMSSIKNKGLQIIPELEAVDDI